MNRIVAAGAQRRLDDDLDPARPGQAPALPAACPGCRESPPAPPAACPESRQQRRRCESGAVPASCQKRTFGEKCQRFLRARLLQNPPRVSSALVRVLAFDELGTNATQQEVRKWHARHLAHDHEAESWRQDRTSGSGRRDSSNDWRRRCTDHPECDQVHVPISRVPVRLSMSAAAMAHRCRRPAMAAVPRPRRASGEQADGRKDDRSAYTPKRPVPEAAKQVLHPVFS